MAPTPSITIEQILEFDAKRKSYREKLSIITNPVETLHIFSKALLSCISTWGGQVIRHPLFFNVFLPILLFWIFLNQFPGWEITKVVDKLEFWIEYVVWWVGLGVLSSVGLGTGFQSGILFLFPHVAKVCIAVQTCKSTEFEYLTDIWMRSPPDLFKCPEQQNEAEELGFFAMWKLIILPCFLQATGTAIGEIPPFWISRAARISALNEGEDVDELPEELESTSKYKWVNKGKQFMIALLRDHGFLGVLLMASWPNIAFDLCGICCGHFLMPFRIFFVATFVGKAFIRNTYQSLLYVSLMHPIYLEHIIKTLQNLAPDYMHLDQLIHEAIHECQQTFAHGKPKVTTTLGSFWNILMTSLIAMFVLSCIQQFTQFYQLTKDNEESDKLRDRLPERVRLVVIFGLWLGGQIPLI